MNAPTPNPLLYQMEDPAAIRARRADEAFFRENPAARWRVRPLYEGESSIADGVRARLGFRAYCVVIHHARAKDRRARAGIGRYPVVIAEQDRPRAVATLRAEARRMARWFKKCSSTPPPARPGRAALM